MTERRRTNQPTNNGNENSYGSHTSNTVYAPPPATDYPLPVKIDAVFLTR